MSIRAPYGSWKSPLDAGGAASSGIRFGRVTLSGGTVAWVETIPGEGGRAAIMSAAADTRPQTRHPDEFAPGAVISARSRVNEYGGGSFWIHGDIETSGSAYWVAAESQQINVVGSSGGPRALTPAPPKIRAWRYAGGVTTGDGQWIVCERELHVDEEGRDLDEAVNDLVAVSTETGEVARLVGPDSDGGGDFTTTPQLSPDGTGLCWLRWDHPAMPWDAAELWAGSFAVQQGRPVLAGARRVAGGPDGGATRGLGRAVSVCLPRWSPDGRLHWCDDSTDWWHLHAATLPGIPAEGYGDDTSPLFPDRAEEVGEPRWVAGGSRYGFTDDGRIVFAASSNGLDKVWVGDPATGERSGLPGDEFTYVESLEVVGSRVVLAAGVPDRPTSVWLVDLDDGSSVDLRNPRPILDPEWISLPEPLSFRTDSGVECHAIFYGPRSGAHEGPVGSAPPLLVRIHGGPTAAARPEFSTSVQFWTTRGFAVADVNYRGSTGYGRIYRDLLQGEWGVSDVEDCIAVARHLGERGLVDPQRCVIRGGSAGGFTALAALCFQHEWGFGSTFAAACSLYGVTDLAALASDTHKFESRYLDGLVGDYPAKAERYRERSPLFHAEQLVEPVLLLQGSEDKIVPPSQAEVLVRALSENGVPHAYVLFRGEGHGFLHPETIIEALETELAFYGQVLGFVPDGDLPTLDLD